ncbi:FAD-binding PCMH-type domain-containing protein [Aphelenchoides fujianensis]|nr:FAD-binding PCMH-type domain-containing protein [Aphelenchoides fujianensis]
MIAASRTRIRSPLLAFARFFNSDVTEKCSKLVPKFEAVVGFCTPDLVVLPGSTEEVAAILRLCNEQKIPVCPSGTRTGIEGAAIPLHKGVVVDMLRMNERAAPASGTTSVRYGTMKNNVKNLDVVLADGRVIHTKGKGRRPWKSSAGYNLTELFVGSEGTLGDRDVGGRLAARPTASRSAPAVCPFPSVEKAVETVVNLRQLALPLSRIGSSPHFPSFYRFWQSSWTSTKWPPASPSAVLEMPAKPTLFLEFHGATEEEVGRQAETAKEVCESNDALDFKWSVDADRINELWKARHTAYYAVPRPEAGRSRLLHGRTRPGGGRHVHRRARRRHGQTAVPEEEFGDVTLGLMRTLKKTLDPNGILNPGKMFPEFNDSGVRIPLHE